MSENKAMEHDAMKDVHMPKVTVPVKLTRRPGSTIAGALAAALNGPSQVEIQAAHIAVLEEENDKLHRQVEELRAVVSKLPRTADGVPICVGDTVFFTRPLHNGAHQIHTAYVTRCSEYEAVCITYDLAIDKQASANLLYSTRTAAESSKANTGETT